MALGAALERRHVDDGELGPVRPSRLRVELRQEHVAREEIVPGELVDHSNREAVLGIGAGPRVEDVELAFLHVSHHVAMEEIELLRLDRTVDRAPVHVALAGRVADDELVVRGAARVLTGAGDERALRGELSFSAPQRFLVQPGRAQVPVDASGTDNPERFQAVRPLDLHRHTRQLPRWSAADVPRRATDRRPSPDPPKTGIVPGASKSSQHEAYGHSGRFPEYI
jgi:hypothetical protein